MTHLLSTCLSHAKAMFRIAPLSVTLIACLGFTRHTWSLISVSERDRAIALNLALTGSLRHAVTIYIANIAQASINRTALTFLDFQGHYSLSSGGYFSDRFGAGFWRAVDRRFKSDQNNTVQETEKAGDRLSGRISVVAGYASLGKLNELKTGQGRFFDVLREK